MGNRCLVCKTELTCMGGRSAHSSNWYCPVCDLKAEGGSFRAQLAEAHAEITEQARLLSMSAEREARLLAKLTECERERDAAESALERKGYRKSCDIPACNCGDQWTHGGHAEMRLTEIREALEQADARRNGETILADVIHALARADRLEAAIHDAPHEEMCAWVRAFRKWQSGPQATKFDAPVKELCDCWKRDALGDK